MAINDTRDPAARSGITERARRVFIPPMPLNDAEMAKWETIIGGRSAAEWETGIDLELAAILAKMLAQYDKEIVLLEQEGTVIVGARGSVMMNPRTVVVNTLRASIHRYETRLRFDDLGKTSVDRKAAREAERKAAQRDQAADDDSTLIQRLKTRSKDEELILRPLPKAVQ